METSPLARSILPSGNCDKIGFAGEVEFVQIAGVLAMVIFEKLREGIGSSRGHLKQSMGSSDALCRAA
jgi:hypothetical protein